MLDAAALGCAVVDMTNDRGGQLDRVTGADQVGVVDGQIGQPPIRLATTGTPYPTASVPTPVCEACV